MKRFWIILAAFFLSGLGSCHTQDNSPPTSPRSEKVESIRKMFQDIERGDTAASRAQLANLRETSGDSRLDWLHFQYSTAPAGAPAAFNSDYLKMDERASFRLDPDGWRALIMDIASNTEDPVTKSSNLDLLDNILRRVMLSHRELKPIDGTIWPVTNAALFRAGIRQKRIEDSPDDPRVTIWQTEIRTLTKLARAGQVDDDREVP